MRPTPTKAIRGSSTDLKRLDFWGIRERKGKEFYPRKNTKGHERRKRVITNRHE
jgi:hypothetical protein